MFKRLFGKKEEPQAPAEEVVEEKVNNATAAMATIQENMNGLNTKIGLLEKSIAENIEAAKAAKTANNIEKAKNHMRKVKQDRERIAQYSANLLQQQKLLGDVDNAAFVTEMGEMMKKTSDVLKKLSVNADEVQKYLDDIEDSRENIKEVMNLLCPEQDEADDDALMDELEKEIADDEKKKSALPDVATSIPSVAQPTVAEVSKDEDADLEDMLADL